MSSMLIRVSAKEEEETVRPRPPAARFRLQSVFPSSAEWLPISLLASCWLKAGTIDINYPDAATAVILSCCLREQLLHSRGQLWRQAGGHKNRG